jgi:hypothetical protein
MPQSCEVKLETEWRPQEVKRCPEYGISTEESSGSEQSQPKGEAMWVVVRKAFEGGLPQLFGAHTFYHVP